MSEDWAQGRREAAAELERRLRQKRAAESARAQSMIDAFLATAATEAVPPQPLLVRGYRGGQARTGLEGWYLKADESVGLGTDGGFYVLRADLTLRERLRGLTLTPAPPPLIVGEGGGDGETIDMSAALERHRRR